MKRKPKRFKSFQILGGKGLCGPNHFSHNSFCFFFFFDMDFLHKTVYPQTRLELSKLQDQIAEGLNDLSTLCDADSRPVVDVIKQSWPHDTPGRIISIFEQLLSDGEPVSDEQIRIETGVMVIINKVEAWASLKNKLERIEKAIATGQPEIAYENQKKQEEKSFEKDEAMLLCYSDGVKDWDDFIEAYNKHPFGAQSLIIMSSSEGATWNCLNAECCSDKRVMKLTENVRTFIEYEQSKGSSISPEMTEENKGLVFIQFRTADKDKKWDRFILYFKLNPVLLGTLIISSLDNDASWNCMNQTTCDNKEVFDLVAPVFEIYNRKKGN